MSSKKFPNVAEVRQQARDDWEQRQRQRTSRIEKISSSIDFWIVLIVLSFVVLSIPHTVKVFDMITPTFGKFAFVGLELGLLYRSFRGKMANQRNEQLPGSLRFLAWLLFVSLVVANGVGAFIAIAESQDAIAEQSLAELFAGWPDLPAQAQIALVLVPLAAFMIPVGTIVGGEGLAALFLEVKEDGNPLDERWLEVSNDIEFLALRDAALELGHTPSRANKWASEVVQMDVLSARTDNRTVSAIGQSDRSPDTPTHATGRGYTKNMSAAEQAEAYLAEYGDPGVSVRDFADMVGVGKTTAGDVLKAYRANNNGHTTDVS